MSDEAKIHPRENPPSPTAQRLLFSTSDHVDERITFWYKALRLSLTTPLRSKPLFNSVLPVHSWFDLWGKRGFERVRKGMELLLVSSLGGCGYTHWDIAPLWSWNRPRRCPIRLGRAVYRYLAFHTETAKIPISKGPLWKVPLGKAYTDSAGKQYYSRAVFRPMGLTRSTDWRPREEEIVLYNVLSCSLIKINPTAANITRLNVLTSSCVEHEVFEALVIRLVVALQSAYLCSKSWTSII